MLSNSRLHLRAAFFRSIRQFFYSQDFLEVDTPVRLPLLIPESMIEPIEADGSFLQTSPELCMKRLLARGNGRIFQICPCFRKNEKGSLHSEEFKMLEWYRLDEGYLKLMEDCITLVRHIFRELPPAEKSPITEEYLSRDWQRLSVAEAFEQFSSVSLEDALQEDSFDEILVENIEPQLGIEQPTFLYDYPAPLASLAKLNSTNNEVAERFELYMHGIEIANGFSELTDSQEQRLRFEEELVAIAKNGAWQDRLPEKFLDELQLIDSAAGIALGLDRLFMLFAGATTLDKAITFSVSDFDF